MKLFFVILTLIAILLPLLSVQPVLANTAKEQFESGLEKTAGKTGHTELKFFEDTKSLPEAIGKVIKFFLSFLGIFFLGLIIYGGFLWMTDRGNEDQVKKAQSVLRNAIIGIIIILAAYAITAYIIEAIITKV
ncbi:MAG: hypothetical protein U9Q85_02400 [Patescibacteria group bacterium]|nr:hypothetical protein [Patescibacteria group bacterium]